MKRQLFHLLFVLLAITAAHAQDLTVCTYNVRYKNSSDDNAGNGWNTRRTYLINIVNFQQPDLLGVQEAVNAQMTDLKNGLTDYGTIGVGRDNGTTGGEYSAIFYRKERMVVLDHGDFWLSDTPYKPSKGFPSKGGSTTYKRICTWGKFYDKLTGVVLWHFNTHMDLDETNRQQSYYLIKQKIQELASTGSPVIITGDYNAVQTGDAYKLFLNSGFLYDSYAKAKQKFITNGTCPGFNSENYNLVSGELRRIDHLFYTKEAFTANRYAVLNSCYYSTDGTATYHLRAYSDHSPVLTKFAYKSSVPRMELPTTPPPIVGGYYQISTPEDLQAFSFIVNGVAGFSRNRAAKAMLLNDIDMSEMTTWLPMGTESYPFTGTFDGQGHTISNISIRTSKSYSGFIGTASGATIKDFRIQGTLIVSEGYVNHGTVGSADASTITNVHSALNITVGKANDDTQHIGGIAGAIYNGCSVSKCSYTGTLNDAGTNTVGGIVGYADGTNNSISYCINCGTVKSNGSETNTGGILGYVNSSVFQMSHCANVGTVTASETHGGQIIGRQMQAMTTLPSELYYIGETSSAAFGSGTNSTSTTGTTPVTTDDVTSGRLTVILNEGLDEASYVFLQNLCAGEQTDPYPVIGSQPEHKVVYVGEQGRQKNAGDDTNYNFYVNEGGHLANLTLDNYFATPVAFIADHACYAPSATSQWGTVYLPYTALSSDNVQLYEVVPELSEGSVLAIAPCYNLRAYTPGLYQYSGGTFELEGNDVPVAVPPTDASLTAGDFLLTGTLEGMTASGGYVLSGAAFHRTTDEVVTPPFAASLTANGAQPQDVTLHIVDATGISISTVGKQQDEAIYNLAGQRLSKMQRGINIINGKKYIRK